MRSASLLLLLLPLLFACDRDDRLVEDDRGLTGPGSASSYPQSAVVSSTDLGTLGGQSSYATDINNAGTVVGWSLTAAGIERAFRWTRGSGMTDLGVLPRDEWSQALSIANDGTILGVSGAQGAYVGKPVTWRPDGSIAPLVLPLLPGAPFGAVTDLNVGDQLIGWDAVVLQHAWYLSRATGKVDITATIVDGWEGIASDVTASGYVVGTNRSSLQDCFPHVAECWHGFIWSRGGGYVDLGKPADDPGAIVTAQALNTQRTVVGWIRSLKADFLPYRWTRQEGFTLLPVTGTARASAINDRGTVVGSMGGHVTVWPASGGWVEVDPDYPFWSDASAINSGGVIAGSRGQSSDGPAHATIWVLGPGKAIPNATATPARPAARLGPTVVPRGSAACLEDPDALLSRATLFQCLLERDRRK